MTSYRIEVSPNNRAGCQDSLCKANGDKIMKGDIRFGVWVEGTSTGGHEFQSWKWRHWGCVSGKTLQNVRESLSGALAGEEEYQWDHMDGLEEMPPEYQEKFKSAITNGKIADEDWNGDPAYNVLGKIGIRGRPSRKNKESEGHEEDAENLAAAETPVEPLVKKRNRAKNEDEDGEIKPAKKRTVKNKKGNADENDETVKKEEFKLEEESKAMERPKKRSRAEKLDVKQERNNGTGTLQTEQCDEEHLDVKPIKKSKLKRGAKKEETDFTGIELERNNVSSSEVKLARKPRSRKGLKEEYSDKGQLKMEDSDDVNLDIKPATAVKGKKVREKEEADEGGFSKKEENDEVHFDVKLSKNSKDKKATGILEPEEDVFTKKGRKGKTLSTVTRKLRSRRGIAS